MLYLDIPPSPWFIDGNGRPYAVRPTYNLHIPAHGPMTRAEHDRAIPLPCYAGRPIESQGIMGHYAGDTDYSGARVQAMADTAE